MKDDEHRMRMDKICEDMRRSTDQFGYDFKVLVSERNCLFSKQPFLRPLLWHVGVNSASYLGLINITELEGSSFRTDYIQQWMLNNYIFGEYFASCN